MWHCLMNSINGFDAFMIRVFIMEMVIGVVTSLSGFYSRIK